MLSILPESAGRPRRSPLAFTGSVLAHAVIIVIVTAATARRVTPAPAPSLDRDSVTWVHTIPTRQSSDGTGTALRDPRTSPSSPGQPVPIEVPVGISPIDPAAPPVEWAIGHSVVDPSALIAGRSRSGSAGGGDHGPGAPYLARPERLAAPVPGNPRPRYPGVLRTAAIEGKVLIDCIVDTTGTIDPTSVRVIDSDHEAFTAAVREVLPQLRFAPAETGGHKVRQWVRIPFDFQLSRNPR